MSPKKKPKIEPIDNSHLMWSKIIKHPKDRPRKSAITPDRALMDDQLLTAIAPPAQPIKTGWILDAEWNNASGETITSFEAQWTVPPDPTSDDQLFYIFIGLKDASNRNLVQCCLQWGQNQFGGDQLWSISSVQVFNNTGTCPVGLDTVYKGDTITAAISYNKTQGGEYFYDLKINNQGIMQSTGVPVLQTCCIVLEAYSVSSENDLPSGSTIIENIKVFTAAGQAQPNWSDNSQDNPDGQHLNRIDSGTIEICYHKSVTNAQAII